MKWILLISLFFSFNVFAERLDQISSHKWDGCPSPELRGEFVDKLEYYRGIGAYFIRVKWWTNKNDCFGDIYWEYGNGTVCPEGEHLQSDNTCKPDCVVTDDGNLDCDVVPPESNYCTTAEAEQEKNALIMSCAANVPDGQLVSVNTASCDHDTEKVTPDCQYIPDPDAEENYCDSAAAEAETGKLLMHCEANIPEGQTVTTNSVSCNRETETLTPECIYSDGSSPPDIGGGGGDGGGDGGGVGGGGDDGGVDGGGGGGDGGPSLDGGLESDFCKENPDKCSPVDKPECVEQPWLCDTAPEPDGNIEDDISKLTQLLQVNNQIADTNNKNNALSFGALDLSLNNQVLALDKQETIKDNTKIIADNTDLATDYLKEISDNTIDLKGLNEALGISNEKLQGILDKQEVGGGGAGGQTNALLGDTNKALADIKAAMDEENKKPQKTFCELNPKHVDCVTDEHGTIIDSLNNASSQISKEMDNMQKNITDEIKETVLDDFAINESLPDKLKAKVLGWIPSGSCAGLKFGDAVIDCEFSNRFRTFFGFVLAVMTLSYCFNALTMGIVPR